MTELARFRGSVSCWKMLTRLSSTAAISIILLLIYFNLWTFNFKQTESTDHVAWFYTGALINVSLDKIAYNKLHSHGDNNSNGSSIPKNELERIHHEVYKLEQSLYPSSTTTTTTTPTVDHITWFYAGGAMNTSLDLIAYRKLHLQLESLMANDSNSNAAINRRLNELEKNLYPWAKRFPTLMEMKHSFKGRGIVVSVARPYMPYVLTLLESLRLVNNTLPIIGYYCGKEELSEAERTLLAVHGLPTLDLYDTIDNAKINLRGYATKAFVALAAPFRELLFVDADVVFFKNPQLLFDHPVYKEKRALLFKDRHIKFDRILGRDKFVAALVPQPYSETLKSSRLLQEDILQEADACLYVIDKVERFYTMLAACKLCMEPLRTVVFKQCIGDKEAQFLASEIVREPYGFNEPSAGIIGDLVNANPQNPSINRVCGNVLHFDQTGEPMFMNGGFANKHAPMTTDMTWPECSYKHWASGDGRHDEDICVTGSSKVLPVEPGSARRIQQLREFWAQEKLGAMMKSLRKHLTKY